MRKICIFTSGPWKNYLKWHELGPGCCFSLPIQTLPTFWVTWIWILRIFIFYFWDPQFPDSQVPKFWISRCPDFWISRFPDFHMDGRAGGGRLDGGAGGQAGRRAVGRRTDERADGRTDGWADRWTGGQAGGRTGGRTGGRCTPSAY